MAVQSYADGAMAVELPGAGRQELVLQAAADTGAKLRGLHPKRSSLEERFMAAIRHQEKQ